MTQNHTPVTQNNVHAVFDSVFAPWVKTMGLTDFIVREGYACAVLPQNTDLHWANGAICGQAIMAAVDTVTAIAMTTTDRRAKGTASQNTQFLRPAKNEDLKIEANVLKFGAVIAYAESRVTFVGSGELVAHSTLEFVF